MRSRVPRSSSPNRGAPCHVCGARSRSCWQRSSGVGTLGAADVTEPSLARSPRGDGFLVWVDDALVVNCAAIGADGSRGATHALGQTVRGWVSAAADDAGTATIAWLGAASAGPGEAIHVLRLRGDGSRTPVRELPAGPAADTTDSLRVAVAPDGTSWAAWNAPGPPATTSSAWAARIDAAGEVAGTLRDGQHDRADGTVTAVWPEHGSGSSLVLAVGR